MTNCGELSMPRVKDGDTEPRRMIKRARWKKPEWIINICQTTNWNKSGIEGQKKLKRDASLTWWFKYIRNQGSLQFRFPIPFDGSCDFSKGGCFFFDILILWVKARIPGTEAEFKKMTLGSTYAPGWLAVPGGFGVMFPKACLSWWWIIPDGFGFEKLRISGKEAKWLPFLPGWKTGLFMSIDWNSKAKTSIGPILANSNIQIATGLIRSASKRVSWPSSLNKRQLNVVAEPMNLNFGFPFKAGPNGYRPLVHFPQVRIASQVSGTTYQLFAVLKPWQNIIKRFEGNNYIGGITFGWLNNVEQRTVPFLWWIPPEMWDWMKDKIMGRIWGKDVDVSDAALSVPKGHRRVSSWL